MNQTAELEPVVDLPELLREFAEQRFSGVVVFQDEKGERYQMAWLFGGPIALRIGELVGEAALQELLGKDGLSYSMSRHQRLPEDSHFTVTDIDTLLTVAVSPDEADEPAEASGFEELAPRESKDAEGLPVWPDLVPLALTAREREEIARMDAEAGLAASVYAEIAQSRALDVVDDSPWLPVDDAAAQAADEEPEGEVSTEELDSEVDEIWLPEDQPPPDGVAAPTESAKPYHKQSVELQDGWLKQIFEQSGELLWSGLSSEFVRMNDLLETLRVEEFSGRLETSRGDVDGSLVMFRGLPMAWRLGGGNWLVNHSDQFLEEAERDECLVQVVAAEVSRDGFFQGLIDGMTKVFEQVPAQALKWDGILAYVESSAAPGLVLLRRESKTALYYLLPGQEPLLYSEDFQDTWQGFSGYRAALYMSANN